MGKIILTPKAKEDIKEIYHFLAETSVKGANLKIHLMLKKIDLLKDFPRIGSILPNFENEQVRELLAGQYRIAYYIVSDDQIDILAVHHSSKSFSQSNFLN